MPVKLNAATPVFSPSASSLPLPLHPLHAVSLQHLLPDSTRRRRKKKKKRKEAAMGSETFLEILLAILLPPVGVFLRYGIGAEFWICLLLTILGYIPGIIYAVYVLVA